MNIIYVVLTCIRWCESQMIIINYYRVLDGGVDLSPQLGGTHSGQSTPHYCPPLM